MPFSGYNGFKLKLKLQIQNVSLNSLTKLVKYKNCFKIVVIHCSKVIITFQKLSKKQ